MTDAKTLIGLAVSPGIAIGRPTVVENRPLPAVRQSIDADRVEHEIERLRDAAHRAALHVSELAREAGERVGMESASIFEAHRLMLEDPTLLGSVERSIREQRVNAEWAVEGVVQGLLAKFERLGDVYLRERKADLMDIAAELQRTLQGRARPSLTGDGGERVLIADDIPPSQAIQLAARSVCGFASETGGATSHTTIIAKSLGIPAVVGVSGLIASMDAVSMVIIDGFEGHVLVDPDPALVELYRLREREHDARHRDLLANSDLPAETQDGHRVALHANIDLLHELSAAREVGAEGVGLFRSEFLFLQASPDLPDENQQADAYGKLVDAFPESSVTVRTFDLGGRKLAREILGAPEDNPVLGLRGVRLCLQRPDFFTTQLRALLRTAARRRGHLRILVPLVCGVEEIRTVRVIIQRLTAELRREGYDVPDDVPIGAMMEVPAAALIADHLCREVDFLAIGTNDLTQYTLAVDRANEQVADLFRPFHPAVLALIDRVIASGRKYGRPVSLCGEMAADPLAVPVLVGLGLEQFSMHPPALPVIRSLVREISFRDAKRIAQRALEMSTAKQVEEFLLETLSGLLAHLKVRIRL